MKLSLKGKHIVITRSASASGDWEKYLEQRGAIIYSFPMIATAVARPTLKLRHAFLHLENFAWIIFTSAAGVQSFKELIKNLHIVTSIDRMPSFAVIGQVTAAAVRAIGYPVAFVPSKPDSATLAKELAPFQSPILLLRTNIASKELPRALRIRGASVVDIPVYKTTIIRKSNPLLSKLLVNKKIDYLLFASRSSVRGFTAQIKGDAMKVARNVTAVALSENIAKVLKRGGFRDIRVVSESSFQGVARLFPD